MTHSQAQPDEIECESSSSPYKHEDESMDEMITEIESPFHRTGVRY